MASIIFGLKNENYELYRNLTYVNELDFTLIEDYISYLDYLKNEERKKNGRDEIFDFESGEYLKLYYARFGVGRDELGGLLTKINELQKIKSDDPTWLKAVHEAFPFLKDKNVTDPAVILREMWGTSEFIEKLLNSSTKIFDYRSVSGSEKASNFSAEEYHA